GNRLPVTLNRTKVQDNAELQAITGRALDADELAPGPIMLQGDHGKVWCRPVTVTPIKRAWGQVSQQPVAASGRPAPASDTRPHRWRLRDLTPPTPAAASPDSSGTSSTALRTDPPPRPRTHHADA